MNALKLLRPIAWLEGVSFLVILGVTMPLKYVFDMPQYNYSVGMAHGVLFMAYIVLVVLVRSQLKWTPKITLICLAASIIPFGTFYIDKKYLR